MFDALQYATLRAVVDRMIPRDDTPGGIDAGVDHYLLVFLQHDGSGFAALYLAVLDALTQEAQARHRCNFADLSAADADALLNDVAHDHTVAHWPYHPGQSLALVAEHCAEGFYADPRQGGNRDMVSWRMIGFEERR